MKISLEHWILEHVQPHAPVLYFQLNSDIPLMSGRMSMYIDVPLNGRMVCMLHPDLMSLVANICHREGIRLVQVGEQG